MPKKYRTVKLTILLVTVGCGSSVEPPPPFVLAVTSAATVQGTKYTVNGSPRDSCAFAITASATGGLTGEYATWQGGVVNGTLTGTTTTSQTFLLPSDLVAWFGSDRVNTGGHVTANRYATWSGPFQLAITLNYVVNSTQEQRAANYLLVCS